MSLTTLDLSNNRLNGSIPSSFSNLQNLKNLYLNDNEFIGPIPQELGKLKLVKIELTNNSFSGSLPDEICNGTELELLLAGNNNLTGQIPKSLYNCSSLNRVRLEGNQLTGDISESFGIYPHLNYINLNDNKLYGEISDNWSKCTNLTRVEMVGNRISGSIPPSLGKSTQLHVLNLSSNDLVGKIPSEFGRMTSLLTLSLSNNHLSGLVPLDLGLLSELSALDLSMNKLNGSIPFSIGDCSKLFNLNLSYNELTHEIPAQIGKLSHLSYLDLSHNLLSGEIPSAISSLNSLDMLNLSQNILSGSIQKTFESMNSLMIIDLSFNQLEGPIPNSRAFMNVSIEALQGNKDLCGNVSGLQPCASERHTLNNKPRKLALVISLPLLGALLLGCLMGTLAFYKWRSKKMYLILVMGTLVHSLPGSHPVSLSREPHTHLPHVLLMSVHLDSFDVDRIVPPDGELPVMNYRMTQELKQPFRTNTIIEEAGSLKMDEGETLNKSNNSENQIGINRRDTSTFGAVHSIRSDLTRTKDRSDLHQNVSNSCDPIVYKLRENGHSTPTSKNQPVASIESYAAGSEKGRKGNVNKDNTMDSVVCSGQSSLSKRSRKSSTVKEPILQYMKRQKSQ